MGKTMTKLKDTGGLLTVNLFGPGMTALHKVGLAGLWMTLRALEQERDHKAELPEPGGSWERTATTVTLRWDTDAAGFFKKLFEESFRIDKNGLVWFPGLGEPMNNPQHAAILQEALLGTFLQHGRTRKSDPGKKPGGAVAFEIDGVSTPLKFHRFTSYSHQGSAFSENAVNSVVGWLFPGGTVRHTGLQDSTALEESPERALCLRYAPVGAIYYEIRRRGGGVKPRYALVLPEVTDLEKYARWRQYFLQYGVQQLFAAGTSEAGFRFLSQLQAANLLGDVRSAWCRVISFGVVPWDAQQKTRVDMMTVRAGSEAALRTFNLCRQVLPPTLVRPNTGTPFWDVMQVPDLVARNLTGGREWWRDFSDFTGDTDRREHIFRNEKGGLAEMVANKEAFPEGAARTFVLACHEAWHRRMGQLSDKAKRQGSGFSDVVGREFEHTRVTFSRCKNSAALREAVTDFWARAGGPLKALQDGWHDILPLLNDDNWREGRDLALLALASYKGANKEEEKLLENLEESKSEVEA